ncbi:Kinesin-like protein KIN-14P [Glycine max]|nr:Kinesin-like protein KIN-14P [Glycine max]
MTKKQKTWTGVKLSPMGILTKKPKFWTAVNLSTMGISGEKIKEKVNNVDENEVVRLIKEQEDKNLEISALKVELETTKRTYEVQFSQMEEEANSFKAALTRKVREYEHQLEELRNEVKAEKINEEVKMTDEEESIKFMKEQEDKKLEISSLMQYAKDAKVELTQKAQEYENQLEALGNKVIVSLP